mmetsp:Transcript_35689/g.91103  ORF Transcript_35689/g.91103 Transcript_35689/m.91103 type:complete len:131 (-) Transcript_35689:345-737(-)|eukprot:jgi/Tetstr1/430683/TSEL_020476.t1
MLSSSFARQTLRSPGVTQRGLRPRGALPTRMAAAAASDPPKYAILTYDYVPDILEKRGPYRAEHLAAAQKLKDEGKLMAAGALLDPVDGAVFLFTDVSVEEAEEFAKNDPYVKAGLVPSWKVRQYMAAIH